jgi:hypothetical protein
MQKPVLRIATWSVALVGLLAACGENIVDPDLPPGAVQFTPPSVYKTWWDMTQSCVGVFGSFDSVRWFDSPELPVVDGDVVTAYWSAGTNQIVLHSSVVRDPRVVRHEMVHALLRSKGHPRGIFMEACGGFVSCSASCRSEGGPAPIPDPFDQRVPSNTMIATATLSPLTPKVSVNDGYFSLTVQATNTRTYPVVVTLGGMPGTPRTTFSAILVGDTIATYDVPVADSSMVTFAAGETKTYVFDFFAGSGSGVGVVQPGQYFIAGKYGDAFAPTRQMTVAP